MRLVIIKCIRLVFVLLILLCFFSDRINYEGRSSRRHAEKIALQPPGKCIVEQSDHSRLKSLAVKKPIFIVFFAIIFLWNLERSLKISILIVNYCSKSLIRPIWIVHKYSKLVVKIYIDRDCWSVNSSVILRWIRNTVKTDATTKYHLQCVCYSVDSTKEQSCFVLCSRWNRKCCLPSFWQRYYVKVNFSCSTS